MVTETMEMPIEHEILVCEENQKLVEELIADYLL
jgi:hypothetical protein